MPEDKKAAYKHAARRRYKLESPLHANTRNKKVNEQLKGRRKKHKELMNIVSSVQEKDVNILESNALDFLTSVLQF